MDSLIPGAESECASPQFHEVSQAVADSQAADERLNNMVGNQVQPASAGEGRKLTVSDFSKVVDWLKVPNNFAALNGSTRRLVVGERHPSKKTVYQLMLITLHTKGFPKFVSTGENLGKRFMRYVRKYKEALRMKQDSGAGLTVQEMRIGITFEDKLEKICPHFQRMHALYGERANVAPPALAATGLPGCAEFYIAPSSDDDDEMQAEPIPPYDAHDGNSPGGETVSEYGSSFRNEGFDDAHTEAQQAEPSQATEECHPPRQHRDSPATTPAATDATFCYTDDGTPSVAPTTEPGIATGERGNPGRKQNKKSPGGSQATSRPNLAEVYMEKLAEKNVYRQEMVNTRDKWKSQDLAERREAREALLIEAREARVALARDARERDREQREHEDSQADRDHQNKVKFLRAQESSSLLMELFKLSRSEEEIGRLMARVPSCSASTPMSTVPPSPPVATTRPIDADAV